MSEKLFTMRCTDAEYAALDRRARASGLNMTDFVKARTGLLRGRAADAAAVCDDPEHLRAMALANDIGAALARHALATAARGNPAPQPKDETAGLSTGKNAMLGEGESERHLPGGAAHRIGDSVPVHDLADLLPPGPTSVRGSSLANLVNEARLPRKGRK